MNRGKAGVETIDTASSLLQIVPATRLPGAERVIGCEQASTPATVRQGLKHCTIRRR